MPKQMIFSPGLSRALRQTDTDMVQVQVQNDGLIRLNFYYRDEMALNDIGPIGMPIYREHVEFPEDVHRVEHYVGHCNRANLLLNPPVGKFRLRHLRRNEFITVNEEPQNDRDSWVLVREVDYD